MGRMTFKRTSAGIISVILRMKADYLSVNCQ